MNGSAPLRPFFGLSGEEYLAISGGQFLHGLAILDDDFTPQGLDPLEKLVAADFKLVVHGTGCFEAAFLNNALHLLLQ
jgi:hypothetical protein